MFETKAQHPQAMRASSRTDCVEYRGFCAASGREFVKYRAKTPPGSAAAPDVLAASGRVIGSYNPAPAPFFSGALAALIGELLPPSDGPPSDPDVLAASGRVIGSYNPAPAPFFLAPLRRRNTRVVH